MRPKTGGFRVLKGWDINNTMQAIYLEYERRFVVDGDAYKGEVPNLRIRRTRQLQVARVTSTHIRKSVLSSSIGSQTPLTELCMPTGSSSAPSKKITPSSVRGATGSTALSTVLAGYGRAHPRTRMTAQVTIRLSAECSITMNGTF